MKHSGFQIDIRKARLISCFCLIHTYIILQKLAFSTLWPVVSTGPRGMFFFFNLRSLSPGKVR